MKRSMEKDKIAFAVILGCMVSMGIGAGGVYLANMNKIKFAEKYSLMMETEKFMTETAEVGAPENLSDETIINAYLSLYNDPYTEYSEIEDIFSEEYIIKETNSSVNALTMGYEIAFDEDGRLYLSAVTENGDAYSQGLRAGDRIISINGSDVAEPNDAKRLRGSDGVELKLKIARDGQEMSLDIICHADLSVTSSVSAEKKGGTLVVKYGGMFPGATSMLKDELEKNSFDSIVFDLRMNGGGEVGEALRTADMFIDYAEVAMHNKDLEDGVFTTEDGKDYDVPVVLVVNEDIASAAEILVALLKQYADATIVGTRTFGKGVYQNNAFFNGGSLNYTAGYYTVGDWECYHGVGIAPDIEVKMEPSLIGTEDDIQLQKALELLS